MAATIILAVSHGANHVRSFHLEPGRHRIGNDDAVEIPLFFPTVSRLHGALFVEEAEGKQPDSPRGLKLRCAFHDLQSRNGTRLLRAGGKQYLRTGQTTPLLPGDKLEVGPFLLEWKDGQAAATGAGVLGATSATDALRPVFARQYLEFLRTPGGDINPRTRLLEWSARYGQERGLTTTAVNQAYDAVIAEEEGHGPVTNYLESPGCREVLVNGPDAVFVDVGQGLVRVNPGFSCERTYRSWMQRLVQLAGRRLDLQNPLCEGTLPGGARLQAVLAPLCQGPGTVAIRRFGGAPIDEAQALASGWIAPEALDILRHAVRDKLNIVVSGGTSAGKTSLLNFLARYCRPEERVVTVEDTLELSLPLENVVALQARRANAEGVGEISLRQLVQCALRLRPDRLIVGECRGAEVIEMLQALNTGHPGSLTTVHANSPAEALSRLELLALMGAHNLSEHALRRWISTSVQLVVQVARDEQGQRFVEAIADAKGTLVYERRHS